MGRRQVIAIGLGLTLVLTACSTDREVTRPEPEPVTDELLADALITIDDLPTGFSEAEPQTTIATEVVPEHDCDNSLADLEAEEEASADFTGPGVRLSSTVAWFPGAGGAVEQLFIDVANGCRTGVVPDDGLAIRTLPLRFGVLSDDTFAFRTEVEPRTGPIEERDVILRREGDLLHIIRLTGVRPSDKALLDQVTRIAIGRLGSLRQATT